MGIKFFVLYLSCLHLDENDDEDDVYAKNILLERKKASMELIAFATELSLLISMLGRLNYHTIAYTLR